MFEAFFSFLALIISIIALSKISNIEKKVNILLPNKKLSTQLSEEVSKDEDDEEMELPGSIKHEDSVSSRSEGPGAFDTFIAWYKHEWMLKTGALFILLGFIWLVSYAFLNNWIGPVGRITIGLVAGAVILLAGERYLSRVRTQGTTLIWLGAGVMTVTIWAAQAIYSMFPAFMALLLLVGIMAVTAFISLRHQSFSLAVASLIVGGLAPLLIGSTKTDIFGLYSYLFTIAVGILWLAQHSKWRVLTFLMLLITALYSSFYFFSSADYLMSSLTPLEFLQLRFFAATLTGLFFMVSLLTIVTNKTVTGVDLLTAGAVGLYSYGWINGLVLEEYKGLVTATAALFYSGASFVTFTRTSLKQPVYLYTAIAIILLAIATAFEFEGPVLVMAFAIQAMVLPVVGVRLLGADVGKFILLYFLLPIFLSLESIATPWEGLFQNSFYALTIVMIALLATGIYFYYDKKNQTKALHDAATFIIIVGSVYALIWIWKVLHVIFPHEYFATMGTLVVYTGIGLFTYITGEIQKRRVLNRFGLFTLIAVIGRLLLVEVWQMELTGRIVTFFMIGILLAGSVLLRKKQEVKP